MWIFTRVGLIMPATCPPKADKSLTDNGRRDLQIRARHARHLAEFASRYCTDLDVSPIEHTPDMDYQYRMYMQASQFAAAMDRAITDIDYQSFKPQCKERLYHTMLEDIWFTVYEYGRKVALTVEAARRRKGFKDAERTASLRKNRK